MIALLLRNLVTRARELWARRRRPVHMSEAWRLEHLYPKDPTDPAAPGR